MAILDNWDEVSKAQEVAADSAGTSAEKYDIYFAHPTENSLDVVDKIVKEKKNIKGLELNIRNHYEDINNFYRVLNNNKLNLIKGSDSHDASLQFYEDMEYFKIDTKDLIKILNS